ncbi:related to ECM32 - DNA dependent ATPase/DNA helicase B [Cephalotrichum gorgonifer]|uniref:Related to ECM32 - DNA dependent ATPase/DNA helicase B n=1 Tax=Cephalotrichum gorgonifer TaxID=2041049 RepID=A0AAE8MWI6_9PEZI|nr:related to ECM32 - DNA dependent ATPase/DNA helicase B [Cephalotrichum gorgonifer]
MTPKPHLQIYTSPPHLEDGVNFHLFPQLPAELRHIIWRKTLERPRILTVHIENTTPEANVYRVLVETRRLHSKLLRVNRESRQAASEFYRARVPCTFVADGINDEGPSTGQEGYLAFNPEHDFLHISSRSAQIARFLYDLRATYDPRHVGLCNLATDREMLVLLLYSLHHPSIHHPNPVDTEVRESVGNMCSQLHEVFFVAMSRLGRQVLHHLHGTATMGGDVFNRSYPIMAQTGPFERLRRDPRDIAQDLGRIAVFSRDPRATVQAWNQLLYELGISPSHVSYRFLLTSKPSAPPCRIYDRESANVFLEAEDEAWMEAHRDEREPDSLDDGPKRLVEPAIGFWLFPVDALHAFSGNPRVAGQGPTPSQPKSATHEYSVELTRLLRGNASILGGKTYLHQQAIKIWANAVMVLDGDDQDGHQFVAKDLTSDQLDGFKVMETTIEMQGKSHEREIICAHDFLKVITHPSLLVPMSLDPFISMIYTFIGARGGDRVMPFFLTLCQKLTEYHKSHGTSPISTISEVASLILNALSELLSREARVRFNDNVTSLLDNVQDLAALEPVAGRGIIPARINHIRRLVARETNRLSATAGHNATRNNGPVRSTFPTEVVVPGGRHDNDHADISSIQILPTHGEIESDQPECLPSTDFTRPHFLDDPVLRHIDCAFRLLRHDIFGPVKDVLKDLLAQDTSGRRYQPRVNGDASARVYQGASILHVSLDRNGLEARVLFDRPPQLNNMSESEQRRWWQESSRLEEGSLIAFVVSRGDRKAMLFLEVTQKNTGNTKEDKKKPNLVSGGNGSWIVVKLATLSQDTVGLLTRLHGERVHGVLVEFHGLIPGTFMPTLLSLQKMMKGGELAFQKWIVPDPDGRDEDTEIPPPAYARKPGFVFNLDSIMENENGSFSTETPRLEILAMLGANTSLDYGQCEALADALMREFALVQGPPGTGKSYLGVQLLRILLDNKSKANLGPIIIICYTNHALDQFLLQLLQVGISKIIRIGGRSQVEELEGKNLRVVKNGVQKTRMESYILGTTFKSLEEAAEVAGRMLGPLHKSRGGPSWEALKDFLRQENRPIHTQLSPVDDEGFELVGGDAVATWLGKRPKGAEAQQIEDLKNAQDLPQLNDIAETNVNNLSRVQRWALAESWLLEARNRYAGRLFGSLEHLNRHKQTINNVHDDIDRRTLLQADVVGMTTTGLARNIEMLRRVQPKVIICEEAAEVMEAHIMSALMPSVEHFIQIGDHRQLRPQILNYSLSLETHAGRVWQLDRSQFERRAEGEPGMRAAPIARLDVQRRMRPEISSLIRTVYPGLKDHESVRNLPDVVGMRRNLYWLEHNHPEARKDDGARVKSHSNDWEVSMAAALVRHLVRQGVYSSTEMALLTPYTGQLRKLRAALSKDFEIFLGERDEEMLALEDEIEIDDVEASVRAKEHHKSLQKKQLDKAIRLATVDNFQGEEAKVIIVSLVRSNKERKVGFLRTENRINVLLSRAQHGMYLIGNAETYLHVPMWANVHGQLSEASSVGTAIPLCCPRHPETAILCEEPEDFARRSPDGGCELPCADRVEPCGHRCMARCHSAAMHEAFSCPKACERIRATCEHACVKLCGEACGPCRVPVKDVELPCGHVKRTVACCETLDLAKVKCTVMVTKNVPGCMHPVEVECYRDIDSNPFSCPTKCRGSLNCGHECPGTCATCSNKDGHLACNKVQCQHSRCGSTCGCPCSPCIEKCTWSCKHRGPCTMPCAAPCNRLPCDERCERLLACGHRCPSFCGEDCPDRKLCQECGERGDDRVDFLEDKTYVEIDLDELPVVALACGHFYTGESLDGHVGMAQVYEVDATARYVGLKGISASLAEAVPTCPDCRVPVRQFSTRRYNRVVNKAVMDETTKRFLASGRRSLEVLEGQLKGVEACLPRDALKVNLLGTRYDAATEVHRDASALCKEMDVEHQPAKRLHDAIITQRRANGGPSLESQMQGLNISASGDVGETGSSLNKQITLKAQLLGIRAQELILQDKFTTGKHIPSNVPGGKVVRRFLRECTSLASDSTEAKLPRITVQAILAYVGIFQLQARESSPGTEKKKAPSLPWDRDAVCEKLDYAGTLCEGLPDSEGLQAAVEAMARPFQGDRYEEVTVEELAAIKAAMVSGSGGLATHSGHWYNCVNGHPFAIGECGMAMERARCPECGEVVGGENHQFAEGVTRATEME